MYIDKKAIKKTGRRLLLITGCIAYTWLFPQIAMQDCVHPAAIEELQNEGMSRENTPEAGSADTPGTQKMYLSEEDCIRLFDISESSFKVTWKWAPF